MNKPKAAPQDLTLLDEFEKNVETVIGILENSVSIIDQWIKDLPKSARTGGRFIPQKTTNDVLSMLHSFYPFADLFPEIHRFLITHAPQFEDRVKKNYSDINKKIQEIVGKCGQDPLNPPPNPAIPYGEMTELRRYIEELVEDLRFCVKAETEQDITPDKGKAKIGQCIKKIIGWIFKKTFHLIIAIIITIIGGLIVAILIDIFGDFGWLEQSKTLIYNVLRLK